MYLYRGEATIDIDGATRMLGEGEATLLLPGHREVFAFSRTHATHHGWCTAVRARPDPATLIALRNLPGRAPFSPLMQQLAGLALPLKGATDPNEVSLRDALIEALFCEYLRAAGFRKQAHPPVHPAVRRACELIDGRYGRPLDLTSVAAHAGVTPAHLIRLFRKHLSVTPRRSLWNVRVRMAADLLRDTALTAAEVAYEVGFANPHHFSRVFKQHHGLPPGAYRKRAWARRYGCPGDNC